MKAQQLYDHFVERKVAEFAAFYCLRYFMSHHWGDIQNGKNKSGQDFIPKIKISTFN